MTTKIETLTDEQWAEVRRLRDEWLAVGLSTEPCDRPRAETAVTAMYAAIDKSAPQFVWCDSPATANLALWSLSGKAGDSLRDSLGGSLGDSLGGSLRDSLGGSLRGSLGFVSWADGGWASLYEVPRLLGLVAYKDADAARLALWVEAFRSCGWWWPYENICVMADRPSKIVVEPWPGVEARVRLHCADGPSMAFRDGWAVHSWHGQRVPAWVVENPTAERIAAEANTEIRRCAIERYGWDRYLTDLGVVPVSEEADPGNPGRTLRLFDLPDAAQVYAEPVRLLVMHNASRDRDGTRRVFAETVPLDCKTAVSAAAWQADVPVATYRALTRAT